MSEPNADVVRDAYAAINRGDMGAFLALVARNVEWKAARQATDPGTYGGHTGVRDYYETRLEVWDELREEPERLIESGERRGPARCRARRRARDGLTVVGGPFDRDLHGVSRL